MEIDTRMPFKPLAPERLAFIANMDRILPIPHNLPDRPAYST